MLSSYDARYQNQNGETPKKNTVDNVEFHVLFMLSVSRDQTVRRSHIGGFTSGVRPLIVANRHQLNMPRAKIRGLRTGGSLLPKAGMPSSVLVPFIGKKYLTRN